MGLKGRCQAEASLVYNVRLAAAFLSSRRSTMQLASDDSAASVHRKAENAKAHGAEGSWVAAGVDLAQAAAGAGSCREQVAQGVGGLGQDVVIALGPRRAGIKHGQPVRVPQRVRTGQAHIALSQQRAQRVKVLIVSSAAAPPCLPVNSMTQQQTYLFYLNHQLLLLPGFGVFASMWVFECPSEKGLLGSTRTVNKVAEGILMPRACGEKPMAQAPSRGTP